MKFRQAFIVPQPADRIWAFFEQPEQVALCIPGVETVSIVDADTLSVRASQKLGPLSATFEARVKVTERVAGERLAFTSTGKAVRGAAGSFRATNLVLLRPVAAGTEVVVEGETALAGVLGSIGHKVIARQADKATAAFARNLEAALASGAPPQPEPLQSPAAVAARPAAGPVASVHRAPQPVMVASDLWTKAAAILSGAAALIGLAILLRFAGH